MNNIHTDFPSAPDFWINEYSAHIFEKSGKKKTHFCALTFTYHQQKAFHCTIRPPPKARQTTRILGMKLWGCNTTYPWSCCSCTYFENIHLFEQGGLTSCSGRLNHLFWLSQHSSLSCRRVFVWFIVFACLILWGLVDFRDDNSFESTCGKCIRSVQICTYVWDRQT